MVFLSELIDWQQINSEAIQGSRPWKVYGAGVLRKASARDHQS